MAVAAALCGKARLHLARQMRHDAQLALDQHQLPAMVHLVFLRGDQHFEAALRRGNGALRHLHRLGEKIVTQPLEPSGPLFAALAQQLQNLVLSAGLLRFGGHCAIKAPKLNPCSVVA